MTNNELRALLDNHRELSCIADCIKENDGKITEDEARDLLEEAINEEEIVYCSRAVRYLVENDASLQTSLSLAADMGYEIKDLHSELLATLLYQDDLREELDIFLSENF